MKLNRKTMKRMLIGLCCVVFATWAALMWGIFRDKPEETPPKEKTPNENKPTVTKEPTVSPTPDDMTEVFLLECEYRTYNGNRRLLRTYRYDEKGRAITCVYEGREYSYEYYDVSYLVKEIQPYWEVYVGETHKTEIVYAPNGQMTIRAEYRLRESDGGLDTISVTEWNEAGLATRIYRRDNSGNFVSDEIIEYDGNGYIISDTKQTSEGGDYVTQSYGECDEEGRVTGVYSVDDRGTKKLTMEISYHEDGSRDETRYIDSTVYTRRFDASGREIYTEWHEGSEDKEYQIHTYTDTPEETVRESKYYRADGTLVNTLITRYDNQGNIIFQKRTDADGTEQLFVDRTRDADGNTIEWNNGTGRKLEYDSHGNLIRETIKSANADYDDIVHEFEYSSVLLEKEVVEENANFYNPVTEALNEWRK